MSWAALLWTASRMAAPVMRRSRGKSYTSPETLAPEAVVLNLKTLLAENEAVVMPALEKSRLPSFWFS